MAQWLGIAVYIEGRIHQFGPGERIAPPKPSDPSSHGRFTIILAGDWVSIVRAVPAPLVTPGQRVTQSPVPSELAAIEPVHVATWIGADPVRPEVICRHQSRDGGSWHQRFLRPGRGPAAPRLRSGNDRNARLRWLSVRLTLAPRLTSILDAFSSKLCSRRRRRIDEILALRRSC
jgi:hypothetical protein